MLTQLEKTIPLLTSNDQSQIVNAIQLLDTMYDLYPSEVEQVWSLLNKDEKSLVWYDYLVLKFPVLSDITLFDVNINVDTNRLVIYVRGYGYEAARGTKMYLTISKRFASMHVYVGFRRVEHIIFGRKDIDQQEQLGLQLSSFNPQSFNDVLTILNSRFVFDGINAYLDNVPKK
jgi:hypothetical protein